MSRRIPKDPISKRYDRKNEISRLTHFCLPRERRDFVKSTQQWCLGHCYVYKKYPNDECSGTLILSFFFLRLFFNKWSQSCDIILMAGNRFISVNPLCPMYRFNYRPMYRSPCIASQRLPIIYLITPPEPRRNK